MDYIHEWLLRILLYLLPFALHAVQDFGVFTVPAILILRMSFGLAFNVFCELGATKFISIMGSFCMRESSLMFFEFSEQLDLGRERLSSSGEPEGLLKFSQHTYLKVV